MELCATKVPVEVDLLSIANQQTLLLPLCVSSVIRVTDLRHKKTSVLCLLAVPGVQRQMDDGNYSSLFPGQQLNNCREQQLLQRPQSYQETSFADRLVLQQGHRDLG